MARVGGGTALDCRMTEFELAVQAIMASCVGLAKPAPGADFFGEAFIVEVSTGASSTRVLIAACALLDFLATIASNTQMCSDIGSCPGGCLRCLYIVAVRMAARRPFAR